MLSVKNIQMLKKMPNSLYSVLKTEFLFHSNKVEGSTFSLEQLDLLIDKRKVSGEHDWEDVIETKNSIELFDFMVETLNEPINKSLILEFHSILKKDTDQERYGQVGRWKPVPNSIRGSDVELSQPWEVDIHISDLISEWETSQKEFEDIVKFHVRFEKIHPFLDGNGRVGRVLMLKQCFENVITPIVLDSYYEKEYKRSLEKAQLGGGYEELESILRECQKGFSSKRVVAATLNSLKNMDGFG